MDAALDFANLFVENEAGRLLYFLIAVGLSMAALLIAIDQRTRSQREPQAARYIQALSGVVLVWGIMTAGNLYALLVDSANTDVIVPPLERATTALVILLLSWAFLTAESQQRERAALVVLGVLSLVIAGAYIFTVITWADVADTQEFNKNTLGLAWTLIPVLFTVGSMVLLIERYNYAADIPLKVIFFMLVLGGHTYALYQMSLDRLSGNVVGPIRLVMLAALALVPVIIYRMVIERFREALGEITGMMPAVIPPGESTRPTLAPEQAPAAAAHHEAMSLLRIAGLMLETSDPHEIPAQIVKTVTSNLKVDIAALVAVEDPNWADPIAAYDSIRETEVPALALNMDNQPTLASAVELNIQCVLLPTRSSDELRDLFHRLDVQNPEPLGPAYFQPLSRNKQVIGMLIVALPYTARLLDDSERNLLEAIGPLAARMLALSREAMRVVSREQTQEMRAIQEQTIRTELQTELEAAQEQTTALTNAVEELKAALEHERDKLARLAGSSGDMSITQQINTLELERQEIQTEREGLMNALQEAQTLFITATADSDEAVYRQMLDGVQQERAALLAEKQRLERELADMRSVAPQDKERLADVINTLTAEKERLAEDHQKLKTEYEDAQNRLVELGIEGGLVGFAQLLAHLTEERNRFLSEAKRAMSERDMLARQLQQAEQVRQEEGRTQQIQTLQTELSRLAADREVVVRQRDALKTERDALNHQRDEWLENRIKLTQEHDGLRRQLEEARASIMQLQEALKVQAEQAPLPAPPPQTVPEAPVAPAETVSDEMKALRARLYEVEEDRSDLDYELRVARETIEQMEEEITRLQVQAGDPEAADTMIGLMQELRTPLTSIMGYTDLLLSESTGILGETQRQFLMRVEVNVEQLMQLIENIIRVLTIDYGKLLLAPRKVNVVDLIDDSITASSAQYREKGLTLHLEVDPDLPEIVADRDALQQILTRLLTNAYLASAADSAVRVVAQHRPDFVGKGALKPIDVIYFAITDQGGGIPEEEHERVFNRHYRAENPLVPGVGDKGAGLSIAKTLVEAHGGQIWVDTEPGVSTTFQVVIPVDHIFGDHEIMRGNVSRLIESLE